jgi:hypothetical protein
MVVSQVGYYHYLSGGMREMSGLWVDGTGKDEMRGFFACGSE